MATQIDARRQRTHGELILPSLTHSTSLLSDAACCSQETQLILRFGNCAAALVNQSGHPKSLAVHSLMSRFDDRERSAEPAPALWACCLP